MLPSLRSTVTRSLALHSRSFGSVQASSGSNKDVLRGVIGTFGKQDASAEAEAILQPPPVERKFIPLDRIEVPPKQDPLLGFFASSLMTDGKRARAEKSTSEILIHIHALTKAPPLPILRQAVELAAPAVRVMRHKSGGKVIVKPVALNERQRTKKAIRWIIEASEKRVGYTRGERIARECVRILQNNSSVLDMKETEHRNAMVSRGNLPRVV
ncbi:30S ribosomal protein S7 [Leucoagaricus sp. SymC.cos]|nr:30S ribosomal protein S7 [Leucoagaricus sp. SymC.cos]